MGKVLVIAEKPDAGRNMAKVLKCDNCKDGYIENEKYIVTYLIQRRRNFTASSAVEKMHR